MSSNGIGWKLITLIHGIFDDFEVKLQTHKYSFLVCFSFFFPVVAAKQPDLDATQTLMFNWFRKCHIPARSLRDSDPA